MGRPKAWLRFGPERLLQRVVRILATTTDQVVVVAAAGQNLPDLPTAVRVVRDLVRDQGPLRGLTTGLAALPESVDLVYASATDVPFLQPAWVTRLTELIGDHDLAIPEVGGQRHPLAALYRRGPVLAAAGPLLAAGQFRLTALGDQLRGRVVAEADLITADPDLATLRNLNTHEEYRQALRDAGLAGNEPG